MADFVVELFTASAGSERWIERVSIQWKSSGADRYLERSHRLPLENGLQRNIVSKLTIIEVR